MVHEEDFDVLGSFVVEEAIEAGIGGDLVQDFER